MLRHVVSLLDVLLPVSSWTTSMVSVKSDRLRPYTLAPEMLIKCEVLLDKFHPHCYFADRMSPRLPGPPTGVTRAHV
jgi:hypothetical protein